ncbi:MAG: trypsin-like serine protease [Pseudomonadota bacterium]
MTPHTSDFKDNLPGRAHTKCRGALAASLGVMMLGGLLSATAGAAEESAIRDYLAQSGSTAYLQQGDFQLERAAFDGRPLRNAVVFQKFIKGIPLHGAQVIVFESPEGEVVRVFDESSESLHLNPGTPAISAAAAEKLIDSPLATGSTSKQVWFRIGNEAILAWEVTTALADSGKPASPTGLETVVDAATGQILSQRQLDSKRYEAGSPEAADGVFPRIVINDTIGPAGSRAYAAPFDAVVETNFSCTGTLIASNVVLSARHCGIGAGDTVIFGDNANGGGIFSATVQSSFLPDGNGSLLDGGDVSIHMLTSSVPANIATPMRLIDETEALEGMLCATLGYGWNGVGSQGHNFNGDGRRWGGENIIDVYGRPAGSNGSNIISTDFDNGTGSANQIAGSSPTPLEFEATTAPGDSGGPVLVQIGSEWVIAGVLSGGTTNTSVYGDISWWTGTAVYRSDIEARGGEFFAGVDTDGDGVFDEEDNCLTLANADQIDADVDGFGNACDGDFTNNCQVSFEDLGYMKLAFFSPDPLADMDGDGVVNFSDLGQLKSQFFLPPGPSGTANICD